VREWAGVVGEVRQGPALQHGGDGVRGGERGVL